MGKKDQKYMQMILFVGNIKKGSKMKTYKAKISVSAWYEVKVEAENKKEAADKVEKIIEEGLDNLQLDTSNLMFDDDYEFDEKDILEKIKQ